MSEDELEVVQATPDDFDPMTSIDSMSRRPIGLLGWVRRVALWLAPMAVGMTLGWVLAKFS